MFAGPLPVLIKLVVSFSQWEPGQGGIDLEH